jgi:phosphoglycolate phosphatase-like HAD superfamily hydrolase
MSDAEEIYEEFLDLWLALIESPDALALDKVQDGVFDCLREWKKNGIELILVTMRTNKHALEKQMKRLKLHSFMVATLICDHAKGGPGKADAVRKMYPNNKRFTDDGIWIGDTEADWEAARSLGCEVVLISDGLRNEEYLSSLGGALVKPSIASVKTLIMEKLNVN